MNSDEISYRFSLITNSLVKLGDELGEVYQMMILLEDDLGGAAYIENIDKIKLK